ncbi:MAG: RNA polymerase sigma factor [Planctomycetota bacterium]|jgi:RNA polymerase sigma-70 factor (ECF subfamily)
MMIEDKLLIWRFKHGSSDALCRIYKKYKDNLLRLASALLNDTAAAEDIVHDFFVDFARSAEKLRLNGNLKSYLATCIVNRVRNANAAGRRKESTGLDEVRSAAANSKRPEQWIISGEQLRQLNDALAQIPYEQREAIILHLQGEMKFKAIAESQGVSINTVQSRYRYGLDKLRSLLDSEVKL